MAIASYMYITGQGGQQIQGGTEIQSRKGSVEVLKRDNTVSIPVDNRTKENRGVRNHGPYNITVILDQSAPYYFKALSNGETWDSIELQTYRIDKTGQETQVYNEKLEDVRVLLAEYVQRDVSDEQTRHLPEQINLQVAYGKITRTWLNGNIQSVDDWKAAGSNNS